MSGKWLVIIATIWIFCAILGSTFDGYNTTGTWAGTGTGGYANNPQNTLNYLMNVGNAVQRLPVLGGIPLPIPNTDYFSKLIQVIMLKFSFVTDTYVMFYWYVLLPIALAGMLCLVLLFVGIVRGNITW